MRIESNDGMVLEPTFGIVLTAAHRIYRSYALYHYLVTEKVTSHPRYGPIEVMFREVKTKITEDLNAVLRASGYREWSIYIDKSNNPPHYFTRGLLGLTIHAKPMRTLGTYVGYFVLMREQDANTGEAVLKIISPTQVPDTLSDASDTPDRVEEEHSDAPESAKEPCDGPVEAQEGSGPVEGGSDAQGGSEGVTGFCRECFFDTDICVCHKNVSPVDIPFTVLARYLTSDHPQINSRVLTTTVHKLLRDLTDMAMSNKTRAEFIEKWEPTGKDKR